MYIIRKTETDDIEAVAALYDRVRVSMGMMGLDQWQKGYPALEDVERDAANGEGYVLTFENAVIGAFMITTEPEPAYDAIDGAWHSDGPYVALHRLAVSPEHRATFSGPVRPVSASAFIIDFVRDFARKHDVPAVRVDTHKNNIPMRRMLEKNGFVRCGTIRLVGGVEDGAPREAYDLIV